MAKNAVTAKAFVQAQLPSYYADEGDTPRAEVYGRVPLKDMEEVAKYKKQCAIAVEKRKDNFCKSNYLHSIFNDFVFTGLR